MSNVYSLRKKDHASVSFASGHCLTVCLSFMCCICIGQGIQGPPGLPGIRGKPGPQVSSGF